MCSINLNSDFSRIFIVVFVTSLSVALINGYPLLFPDSYAYLGFSPSAASNSFRQVTLDFLARPLYPLLGVWSVVVIQATLLSYLIACFSALYLVRINAFVLAILMIVSQVPIYVAFVMPDIWLIIFILAFLVLVKEFHWPPFLILAFAITVHGSHLYIFIASVLAALVIFTGRARIIKVSLAAILLAILITGFVNSFLGHDKNKELAWTLVGSKILVQIPDAVERKCSEDADFLLCTYRKNIQEGASECEGRPDCYVWEGRSFLHDVNHSEMEAASRELFIFTLLNMPGAFIEATLVDLLKLQRFECNGDLGPLRLAEPGIEPDLKGAPLHPTGVMISNAAYERSLQAANVLSRPRVCVMLAHLKMLTYLVAMICLALLFFIGSREASRTALFCVVVLLINDLIFAALSGPYLRYNDRGLFLLMIPLILTINEIRSRRPA